jgi:predicted nucleotidyltransferase component of viral defense system
MSVAVIQERLLMYECKTIIDQENALKEIAQEIALMTLSRADFFRIAAFQGGTCLRILYNVQRFSEDLDFVLEKPDRNFNWERYINTMHDEFSAYGFALEIKGRAKVENAVKIAFLKADSEGGILIIKDSRTNKTKLKIKLEIDTNPPEGSSFELKYLDFPLPYSVKTQDLTSLFAGKCHALLCRSYTKGRDWYDFIWYISRKTPINFILLSNAITQAGPWKDLNVTVTPQWLLSELETKIYKTNWHTAKQDVAQFLRPRELKSLELWSEEFFLSRIEKMYEYMLPTS